MEGPLSDRSTWKAKSSLPEELDPVLSRVKTLARGGLTSMMVLGDFLRRRITPLQQRSRMASMYTGPNDCCRIARGPGTDLTRAELEASIQAMTGEAYTLESLILPRGIKALCEDQAMRSAVLASMPTLDKGGLAVRQVGGDPNHGIQITAPRPTASSAPTKVPVGPATEVWPPPGRVKGRNRSRSAATSTMWAPPRPGEMTRRGKRPPPGVAKRRGPGHGSSNAAMGPLWGSRPPSARRRRSWRGRAAPKLHYHCCNTRRCRGGWRRHGGLLRSNRFHRRRQRRSAQRRRHHHHRSQGRKPRPRRQGCPRREGPTRGPGSLQWERRNPRSPGEIGCGLTLSKQLTHAFLCSIQFLGPNPVGVC
jgi:hypothetical protein